MVDFGQVSGDSRCFVFHVSRQSSAHNQRAVRDQGRVPDFDQIVHVNQTTVNRLAQRARGVAVSEVADHVSVGHASVIGAVGNANDGLLVPARESGRFEVSRQIAVLGGQFRSGNQIARGRVGFSEGEGMALGVVHRGDARSFVGDTDRVIALCAVNVHGDQARFNGLLVGQHGFGIGRSTKPCHVNRAAQQTLDHAVIVSGREQFDRNAQSGFDRSTVAFVAGDTVLSVFAAQNADVKFFDRILRESRGCQNGGSSQNGEQLFHGRLQSFSPMGREQSWPKRPGWNLGQHRFGIGRIGWKCG